MLRCCGVAVIEFIGLLGFVGLIELVLNTAVLLQIALRLACLPQVCASRLTIEPKIGE